MGDSGYVQMPWPWSPSPRWTPSAPGGDVRREPQPADPGPEACGQADANGRRPLDLLGVDEDGRLVVFELKRGTLSRDAVAQIIDYASDLDSKSDSTLAEHISDNSGVGGIER